MKHDDTNVHPLARRFLWLDSPKLRNAMWIVLLLAAAALVGLEFTIYRHPHFTFDAFPGFHALLGGAAFTFVVLMGWPLRKLLGRPENYYQGGDEDA